jgi:hypothetical protein
MCSICENVASSSIIRTDRVDNDDEVWELEAAAEEGKHIENDESTL